jgi:hypothetical protein
MKHKTTYTILLLVVTTLVLSWAAPALVKMATGSAHSYPFVYYSSLLQRFVIKKTVNNKPTHYDTDGRQYTREQYDSITPLFSYRQLMLINALPDTILGVGIEPRVLRSKTVMWRYAPRDMHQPVLPLYIMYEAMSGRASLESPDDVFRLKDNIEFVDKLTNAVNEDKSALFQQKMEKEGFAFPAQRVWGNLSIRKPYDEGYFVLDSRRQLFHIKQVNGRPYVRNTRAGDSISIAHFDVLEVADKSIYGFALSADGSVYTLSTEGYALTRFDIPAIDLNAHSVMLMGNVFYWIVNVQTPDSSAYHVLEAGTLLRHDAPHVEHAAADAWGTAQKWLFPVYISLSSKNSAYLTPTLHTNFGIALLLGHLIGIGLVLTLWRKRKFPLRFAAVSVIILFGISGLIANFIINK